jgi:hypothetical protein
MKSSHDCHHPKQKKEKKNIQVWDVSDSMGWLNMYIGRSSFIEPC